VIRCTDWAETNLRSVGPVSHRGRPQRRVHGSRHLASNRRSPLPQCFGAHCATSFATANSPHPYSFMSRSSPRSPGTAFGALALSTDAFGRSSLVVCPAQSACSRHTIAGPKDAWLSQNLPSARLLACWTLYSAKCARARASARDLHVQCIRASPPQRKHSARCATVVAGGFGTEVLPLVRTSQRKPRSCRRCGVAGRQ
jgi:hypothetical protein